MCGMNMRYTRYETSNTAMRTVLVRFVATCRDVVAAALVIVTIAATAGGATQIIAITGNPAPDGNGVLSTFNKYSPAALNDVGQVAFYASLAGTTGGQTNNEGIFLGTSSGRTQVVRTGEVPPDGIGKYEVIGYRYGFMLNEVGQVAF